MANTPALIRAPIISCSYSVLALCILFDFRMALRQVPRGILRDLGKRRFPPDDLPEKIVAALFKRPEPRENHAPRSTKGYQNSPD